MRCGFPLAVLILLHIAASMFCLQHLKGFTSGIAGKCVKGVPLRCASTGPEGSLTLAERVYRDLTTVCGVSPSTCLLLCVSGGVDSMAMLHLVGEIKQKYLPDLTAEVLNFNHKLRPESSEKERDLVEKWSKYYELPFHCVERGEEEAFGDKGMQEAAREWRQETTKTLLGTYRNRSKKPAMIAQITGVATSEEVGGDAVAVTAHHADDQVETSLMKIIRGVHISRMYAMLPRSDCSNFIKPLLGVSKEELLHYMKANDYPWLEDESNLSRKYKRNAVRLDVVSAMASLAGGKEALQKRFDSMSQQSRELRAWLEAEARAFLTKSAGVHSAPGRDDTYFYTAAFAQLPQPVQCEVVHFLISQATGVCVDYDKCKAVAAIATEPVKHGGTSRSINIAGAWVGTKIGEIFRLEDKVQADRGVDMQLTAFVGGTVEINHPAALRLQVTQGTGDDARRLGATRVMVLSGLYEKGESDKHQLELRYPLLEDTFLGGKLTEYLRTHRVPLHHRDRVLLLVGKGSGKVLGLFMPPPSNEAVVAREYEGQGQGQEEMLTLEIID